MDSILASIRKLIGAEVDEHFDVDLITAINTALMYLWQIGVGPSEGFTISDDSATWSDFIPNMGPVKREWVKTYVHLNVKLIFDPPLSSAHIEAINRQIKELEWRLNVAAETPCSEEESQNG